MQLSRVDHDRSTTIRFEGRLDAYQVPAVRSEIDAISGDLVLDLGGVGFIDSTGLAMLVGLCKQVQAAGHTVKIVNLQDPVRLILEITRLDQVLPVSGRPYDASPPTTS